METDVGGPGGIGEDCGHFAGRHHGMQCRFPRDARAIAVTFWKLRVTRDFNPLFPDLADNWIDDMREFYGEDAGDYTKTHLSVLTEPDWSYHPTT